MRRMPFVSEKTGAGLASLRTLSVWHLPPTTAPRPTGTRRAPLTPRLWRTVGLRDPTSPSLDSDHGSIRREPSMTTTIQVVAGVASLGDTVLACRRAPGRTSGGRWEFPGGKVEAGERPQDALARELREELDADVAVGRLLDRSTVTVGELAIDLACYEVTFRGGAPVRSTDHDELRWVTRAQLVELDWAAPDLPMVGLLTAE